MYPQFIIFGRTIGTYGLFAIIGLIICTCLAHKLGKKHALAFEDVILLMLSTSIGLLVGGHLLFAVTNINKIITAVACIGIVPIKNVLKDLIACFGGAVYYGGFIGAIIAIIIHTKVSKKFNHSDILDIFAVLVPLFHVFGRIGCFFGGCCYGIESKFGFTVNNNILIPEINGVNRFPVQLTEAFINLCIFIALLIMFNKNIFKGMLIYFYMLIYSIARFNLEFLRGDIIRGIWFGISTSQWISIILFIIALYKIILMIKTKKINTV